MTDQDKAALFDELWEALPDCEHEDCSPAKCGAKATRVAGNYACVGYYCDTHGRFDIELPYANIVRRIQGAK